MNNHTEEQLLRRMIELLAQEAGESLEVEGKTVEELKAKWRGLVNIRQPKVAPAEFYGTQLSRLWCDGRFCQGSDIQ